MRSVKESSPEVIHNNLNGENALVVSRAISQSISTIESEDNDNDGFIFMFNLYYFITILYL